jgi:hypothetical protein
MKYILAVLVSVIGMTIFILLEKKKVRNSKAVSGTVQCHRCYNGFDENELGKVWHFNYAPLRLLIMDLRDDLNKSYCQTCRVKVNIYMVLSLFITVPILLLLGIVVMGQLGLWK